MLGPSVAVKIPCEKISAIDCTRTPVKTFVLKNSCPSLHVHVHVHSAYTVCMCTCTCTVHMLLHVHCLYHRWLAIELYNVGLHSPFGHRCLQLRHLGLMHVLYMYSIRVYTCIACAVSHWDKARQSNCGWRWPFFTWKKWVASDRI